MGSKCCHQIENLTSNSDKNQGPDLEGLRDATNTIEGFDAITAEARGLVGTGGDTQR